MNGRLAYAGHRLRLGLPEGEAGLADFLDAYFRPYFDVEEDAGGPAFARLDVHVGPPPPAAPDFAGGATVDVDRRGGFLRCRGSVVEQAGLRWVRLEPSGAVVRADAAARAVDVWGASGAALRVPVLRLVEDLTLDEVQRAGAVVLHASAVVVDGRAVLAVGNKRAGKTTTLCRLLAAFDADKMANDNVCLFRRAGAVVARGWPSFFKVAAATVASHLELAGDFPPAERARLGSDAALWSVYEKVVLYPAQGAARFGARLRPEAPLGCIVLPRFSEQRAPALADVPAAEAVEELQGCLQGIHN
ncbi:MAG TPA: hypothetical protein VFX28_02285, partial [Methylomirabilota bacterium]|nr:hypothetical protein [Methylomirabilota bacterium]